MKPISVGWFVTATITALVVLAMPARPQDLPPTEPILRIETGMHGGGIQSIAVDSVCRQIVTAADDKTVRLWAIPENGIGEAKLQRVLRVPIGFDVEGLVIGVALSPNGRFVAAGGYDVGWRDGKDIAAYVFEAQTGKLVRRLGSLERPILNLTFSPNGEFLVASLGGQDRSGGIRVWKTADWSRVDVDNGREKGGSYRADFDLNGKLYTADIDGFLRRYGPDFKLEAEVRTGGPRPRSVAVHPAGDRVAIAFAKRPVVEIYDTNNLKLLFGVDAPDQGDSFKVAWSGDGSRLFLGGRYFVGNESVIRIWDLEGHGKLRDVAVAQSAIMRLLPCGDAIAVGAFQTAFGLISLTGEKRVWKDGTSVDMRGKIGANFTVSEDGSSIRFGLGRAGDRPVQFDLLAGRLADQAEIAAGFTRPNTEGLPVTDWHEHGRPRLDGEPLERLRNEMSRSLAIAPEGTCFVLGTDSRLIAYSKDGKELWQKPSASVVWGVNISRGGKFVVAAYGDGTIRWHRLSDGNEVLALFVDAETREWVAWTPQGYYTSSVFGDQYVGWHLNKGWEQASEFVTAARLKKHLYRPDIIKRAFELADAEAAVREAGLSGFKLDDLASHTPPEFRIVDPGDKTHADKSPVAVRLELGATNDPVIGVDIKVNGRQVTPRDVRDIPQLMKEAETRDLNIPLQKGENHIQVVARNGVGETVQDLLVYLDREGVLDRKGRLFIVAIGVDKYSKLGSRYSLRYAGADARLMVDTLTKKSGPLHTEVVSKLLTSDGDIPPTKANIEDALALFRDANPEDTVILFIASHGVNDGADYLMIPEDAERNDAGRWRPSTVVLWSVLQKALQDAQGSRIMFVDTCHSSGAYSSRLVKDAADANIVVFSATDKDTEAQETSKLGHGVFTYALSEGINGGADFGKKGIVNVLSLGAYVSDEVKRMTNDEQEPVFSGSGVKNFVLATP